MRRSSLYATLVVCLAVAGRAEADPKKEAERHFKLGVALYGETKYSEALTEFERAYELSPHPAVLYNLGATHRELSHYDDAIQNFERFLTEAPGKVKPELLDKAKKELEELRARVGTIEVTTEPAGATVAVDGRDVGETPLPRPLVLGPGPHTFEIRGPNGRVETRTVTIAAGDATSVHVELKAEAVPDRPVGPVGPVGGPDTGVVMHVERPRHFSVGAAMATNTLEIAKTGAPTFGVSAGMGRFSLGVDVVAVAWAVMPSLRVRLLGDAFQVHLVAAAPISFTDGDTSKTFVAGAGGLGIRYFPMPAVAIRAEALVSFAGSDHGTTVPASMGVELWF